MRTEHLNITPRILAQQTVKRAKPCPKSHPSLTLLALLGLVLRTPALQTNPPKLPCSGTYPEELKKVLEKLIKFYDMVFVHM